MDVEPGLAPVESMEDAGDEDAPVQTQDIELAPADADEDVELIEYDEDVSTVGAPQGAEPADEEIQEAPAEEFAEAPESPTAREPAITVDDDENEAQQISSGGSERDLKGGSGDQGPVNLSSDVEGLEDYEEEEEEEYDRRPRSSRKTATNDEYEEVYDEDSDGEDPLITAKVSQQKARPRQAPPREEVFEAPPCMILSYKDELFTLFAKPSEDHPIFAQFGDIDPLFEGRGDLVGGLISSFIFALKEEMEIKNVDVTLEFPSLGLSFGQVGWTAEQTLLPIIDGLATRAGLEICDPSSPQPPSNIPHFLVAFQRHVCPKALSSQNGPAGAS